MLPPGDYFVASGLGFPDRGHPPAEMPQPMPGTLQLRQTFHPSRFTPELAAPIVVAGGENVRGKDIAVRQLPVIEISGVALNSAGVPATSRPPLQLKELPKNWLLDHNGVIGGIGDGSVSWETAAPSGKTPDGRFVIRGAFPPGTYEIRPVPDSTRPTAATAVRIEIGSENIAGVVVQIKD
jgi:hypothetical protein